MVIAIVKTPPRKTYLSTTKHKIARWQFLFQNYHRYHLRQLSQIYMDEFAQALHVSPKLIYAILGLILIATVYQYNPQAGLILGLLAIVAILTQ